MPWRWVECTNCGQLKWSIAKRPRCNSGGCISKRCYDADPQPPEPVPKEKPRKRTIHWGVE